MKLGLGMVAAGCRRPDGLTGRSRRKVFFMPRTGSPKSRSEEKEVGWIFSRAAGSSPARDKAFLVLLVIFSSFLRQIRVYFFLPPPGCSI